MTLKPPDAGWRTLEREHWNARRLLERQLHDGPTLRLSALALELGLLQQRASADATGLSHDIAGLQEHVHQTLQELRAFSDRLYPPLLFEAGLSAALDELSARADPPVEVDLPGQRLDPLSEALAYFLVVTFLDRCSGTARVTARMPENGGAGELVVELAGARPGTTASLSQWAVAQQVAAVGGSIEMGTETTGSIRARIPCE